MPNAEASNANVPYSLDLPTNADFQLATVFYLELMGISSLNQDISSKRIMHQLDILFTILDYCTTLLMHEGLEKLQQTGSNSFVVLCSKNKNFNHCEVVSNFAILVKIAVDHVLHTLNNPILNFKIGIHSGNIQYIAKVGLHSGPRFLGTSLTIAREVANTCEFGKIQGTEEYIVLLLEDSNISSRLPSLSCKKRLDKVEVDGGNSNYFSV
jgi:hypothetical protein